MNTSIKLAVAAALTAGASLAQAEFSANVALTNDYVFRGISQTDEHPAIQGGFDFSHDSGFHAGIWGSNVDFNDGDEATVEIDYSVGFGGKLVDALSWDLSAIYYTYPGAHGSLDYDYWELTPSLSYDFGPASVSGAVFYSPDFFGGTGDAVYYNAGVEVPLPQDFAISASIGRQTFSRNAMQEWTDWKVGVSKELGGFGFELAYTDTNLSKAECGNTGWCDGRVLVSVSKSF